MTNELTEKSDKDLQSEYQSLFQSIHVIQCFGTKDCLNLDLIGNELERRGYDIQEGATVTFVKEDTDENEEDTGEGEKTSC